MAGLVRFMERLDLGPRDAGRTARLGAWLVAPWLATLTSMRVAWVATPDLPGAVGAVLVFAWILSAPPALLGASMLVVSGGLALFWSLWRWARR